MSARAIPGPDTWTLAPRSSRNVRRAPGFDVFTRIEWYWVRPTPARKRARSKPTITPRADEDGPGLVPEARDEGVRDRRVPRPLRDQVDVARDDPFGDQREGGEGRKRRGQEEGTQRETREGPPASQDGLASGDPTGTAARRDGTTPATAAARTAMPVDNATGTKGVSRITRFGSPTRG